MIRYLNRIRFILFYIFYSKSFKYLAYKAMVYASVRIQGAKYISIANRTVVQRGGWLLALKISDREPLLCIGENCAIGDFSHISSVQEVVIENNVLIANKVYISDNLHAFEDINQPIIAQKVLFKREVKIKEGAWLGENVCIIGASVGKNSVIGANSVVTKDIPDFCVAVGTPARVIKRYDPDTRKWVFVD